VGENKIFVISGPGGAGKTTLVNRLFGKKDIQESCLKAVTVTTRGKRPQEKDGQDYFFVTEEEFLKLKGKGFFLESQKILDNYYGTPKLFYGWAKAKGKHLILCIDVKGGMCLKKSLRAGKISTIFIAVPAKAELYRRMGKRAEAKGVIKKRVELAKEEMRFSKYYDYLVVNKDINVTLQELERIILGNKKLKGKAKRRK